MQSGIYTGGVRRLKNRRAILRPAARGEDYILAQFDSRHVPEAFGWHEFKRKHFVNLEGELEGEPGEPYDPHDALNLEKPVVDLSYPQTVVLEILKENGGWMTLSEIITASGVKVQWKTVNVLFRQGLIERSTDQTPGIMMAYRAVKRG